MINLLPPELQDSYRYARRNRVLARWVVACGTGLVGLVAISGAGWVYLHQAANNYSSQISTSSASLAAQKQSDVDNQAKDISNSVKLAVQILSKEVLFSSLLKQLAVVTPPNSALANITINQVKGAIDITANTASYNEATQLQVNLMDPRNKIFSKADIVSIACSTASSGSTAASATASRYPCAVTIRALFATKNPFLFINTPSGKAS